MNFWANNQSLLKQTKQFKKYSAYLVIKRQLLLSDWEYGLRHAALSFPVGLWVLR